MSCKAIEKRYGENQISVNEAEIVIRRIFIDLDCKKRRKKDVPRIIEDFFHLTGNFSSLSCVGKKNRMSEEGRNFMIKY